MIMSQVLLPMILLLLTVTSTPQITLSSTSDPEPPARGDTFYLLGRASTPARDVDVYLSAVGNPFPPYVDPGPEEPLLQTWQIYGVVGILLALAGYVYLWKLADD